MISPPGITPACSGDQIEWSCTTTGSLLEWRIIPEQNHSTLEAQRHIPTGNVSFQYGDSTIRFIRISHPMLLTSYRILLSPVSNSLNGTEVMCTDLVNQQSSSTVIKVVNCRLEGNQEIMPIVSPACNI